MSEVAASPPDQAPAIDTETLFSLFGRAHTLAIINEMVLGDRAPVRFSELQATLDLSPNTLSRRLEELVELGFLHRTQYDEIPPRVEYEPTNRLTALEPTFRELSDWMDRYGSEPLCETDG